MLNKIVLLLFLLTVSIGTSACGAEGDDVQNNQVAIKPGDVVEIVSDRTKFMDGTKVLATLEKGSQLDVRRVEGGWIGGKRSVGGEDRIGWVRREDVKRIKAAPPAKSPSAPLETSSLPTTKKSPTVGPQRSVEKKSVEKKSVATTPVVTTPVAEMPIESTPSVRTPGFFRVALNARASNGEFTTEVLMARHAKDLAEIEPSEKIGRLILVGKGVTNRALKEVRGLNVRMLHIDGTRITNSGLEYLEDIEGLRVLWLWSGDLTDTALARIKNLTELEALDLEGANARGTGLVYLKSLENLRALVLGPGIEDSELKHLGNLTHLEELDLRSCRQITDAGLTHLGNLKNLRRIAFPRRISTEAKRSLGQKLPECEFYR